ncbi:MAG: sigma-54-dependent transcriptional regulator [Bacillota bacterium]
MKKIAVLIVDDEENVLKLLDKIFTKEGYITYTACDGKEALKIIDSRYIDIVITDIRMPEMGGIELLNRIRDIDPSIKVILITAFAALDTAIHGLRMGASDYITKPFNLDEILFSVNKIADNLRKYCSDDEIAHENEKMVENYLVAESPVMSKTIELIRQVADSRATVILYGETGTGKELAAQLLHNLSGRKDKPFVKVNCAAIPELLLESELFGYERGAFTGAVTRKPGRFELAEGGTLFLDEIGDIPPTIQVKLLRVLQQKEFERLGGTKTLKVDVRIIAATNKCLEELVAKGEFREDLYYRLNVVPITMPALRERKEDIPILVKHFLHRSAYISGKPKKEVTEEVMEKLVQYNWPGNIRELENIIERCVVVVKSNRIAIEDLPVKIAQYAKGEEEAAEIAKLDEVIDYTEKEIIVKTLKETGGNRTKAAETLGISRRSLHRKLNKYQIEEQ